MPETAAPAPRPRRYDAQRLLFPAAAVYAAVAVPAALAAMRHDALALPGLATPAGHAHEMLFGYALAVVAGFLVRRTGRRRAAALAGLWLLARGTWLAAPGSVPAAAANVAFALLVALLAVPGPLGSARKLRNRALPVALAAMCAAELVFQYAAVRRDALLEQRVAFETVLLLSLLMAFMGGRIIAPAAAGYLQRQGRPLRARVQPYLEGLLLVLLLAAVFARMLPGGGRAAGTALALAGVAAAVRLLRWRPWSWVERRDLLALAVGYAWLAAGLLATGVALALAVPHVQLALLHMITVGGVGTLTLTVMGRSLLQRQRRMPPWVPALSEAVALLGLATLARVAGGLWPALPMQPLWTAALLWLVAFALLARELLRVPRSDHPG